VPIRLYALPYLSFEADLADIHVYTMGDNFHKSPPFGIYGRYKYQQTKKETYCFLDHVDLATLIYLRN